MGPGQIVHTARVVGTLAARALGRRLRGEALPAHSHQAFVAAHRAWSEALPRSLVATTRYFDIQGRQPPWFDTGIDLEAGDPVTLLSAGRVYLSRALDLWFAPRFQLWCRIGESGPIFRGTRDTHTFVAAHSGRLYLASYFPGEWADRTGRLATPPEVYRQASGSLSVLLLRWAPGVDAARHVAELATDPAAPALLRAEAERLATAIGTPAGWDYLWMVGPAEIYRPVAAPDGRPAMACHTHADAAILHRDTPMPLSPGTFLEWTWKVDELPSDLPEDTLPSHDYMSIAVEFDDGQDLTYYWSAALPVGKGYRCPLPGWDQRETHVVLRTGREGLGQWYRERRDLHADYAQFIGTPPASIRRVWLIAISMLQRRTGRCEYADVRLMGGGTELRVI